MDMGSYGGSPLDFATYIQSAMKDNKEGDGFGNNGLLWIFLILLFGWGGGGNGLFGNRNGAAALLGCSYNNCCCRGW